MASFAASKQDCRNYDDARDVEPAHRFPFVPILEASDIMVTYGPVVSRFLSRRIGEDAEISCLTLRTLPLEEGQPERMSRRQLTKSPSRCEMGAWPGGPCPDCGQDMPKNLIHCQFCRRMLNESLPQNEVVVPEYFDLQEIDNVVDAPVAGFHVQCPHCEQELRINKKYAGMPVACKHCSGQFKLDIDSPRIHTKAFYVGCPHCDKELRVAPKYVGMTVACKFCSGHVKILSNKPQPEPVKITRRR